MRREPYTKVERLNAIRAEHVKGMGDVVFKGFQCLNPECQEFIFVRLDEIDGEFEVKCPACNYRVASGQEIKFFDYRLKDKRDGSFLESGEFTILHDDYVTEAQLFKYCILCNTIKPLAFFDRHGSRKSGHQGECNLCKRLYNSIKNKTRLTDQHREAAQKRRLYMDLAGGRKINSSAVYQRFKYRCFVCGEDLSGGDGHLDHTLPAYYLWPLTTENATLLCEAHNEQKVNQWPGAFYSGAKLKELAAMTGLDYDLLQGEPRYNPTALARLRDPDEVDALLVQYSPYREELIKFRNRLLRDTKLDIFAVSTIISQAWIRDADGRMSSRSSASEEPGTDD